LVEVKYEYKREIDKIKSDKTPVKKTTKQKQTYKQTNEQTTKKQIKQQSLEAKRKCAHMFLNVFLH